MMKKRIYTGKAVINPNDQGPYTKDRETWIHTEDYGLVMKTHWTHQKDLKFRPLARKQPFKCPKCKVGQIHSIVLCTMDNLASSPSHSEWIYKCKNCGFQFTNHRYPIENHLDCGDLEW